MTLWLACLQLALNDGNGPQSSLWILPLDCSLQTNTKSILQDSRKYPYSLYRKGLEFPWGGEIYETKTFKENY